MTDLSDTIPVVEDDELDIEVVEMPSRLRRRSMWAGGAVLFVGLVLAGGATAARIAPDPIAASETPTSLIIAGVGEVTEQVASAPPTLPCVTWSYGIGLTQKLVVSGEPCVDLTITDDGTPIASTKLGGSPIAIGPVGDPILHTPSASVPGQIYGDVLVMLERDAISGVVSAVGRSTSSFAPLWIHSCATASTVPSIHLSGGDIPDDPGANRSEVEVFGVVDYVALGCDDTITLYDPLTGATI